MLGLLCSGALLAASELVPTQLRCEYLANLLGIDESRPRLSWQCTAIDPKARFNTERLSGCGGVFARVVSQRARRSVGQRQGCVRTKHSFVHRTWWRSFDGSAAAVYLQAPEVGFPLVLAADSQLALEVVCPPVRHHTSARYRQENSIFST